MADVERATVRELRPTERETWFRLRRHPLSPGPLEPLRPGKRWSVGGTGLGLVGLSLVLSLILAPQIRASVTAAKSEPVGAVAGEQEEAKPLIRRVDVVARPPAQSEARVSPVDPMPDQRSDETTSRQEASAPTVAAQPAKPATPVALLEPLPVLELDEASFEAAPLAPSGAVLRTHSTSRGTP